MIYKCLHKQFFANGNYSIVPLRMEDRLLIMKWRNEQIYHLRQDKLLTEEDQNRYFASVVNKIFDEEKPNQLLFSYMEGNRCIGYGGLVHINWIDKNAEISFVMETALERESFQSHWVNYLTLIEQLAFEELNLHKIYTYAFDLRPYLFDTLEVAGYFREAVLKEHCFYDGGFIDVIINSKLNNRAEEIRENKLFLREASETDAELLFNWANESIVRANSINKEHIVWENHLKWFNEKINNAERNIFILCCGEKSLGQIRIDKNDSFWDIDYSVDFQHRGKGFGKELVKLLLEKFSLYKFRAIVKKQNKASINVFTKLGFKKVQIENEDLEFFEYKIN